MIEQTIKIAALYDFYGVLLTERQQKCIEMHYLDDFSLAEVAEQLEVSRQAVHDILKRSVQAMQELEQKLGLVRKYQEEEKLLIEIDGLLKEVESQNPTLSQVREKIRQLLS